MATTPAARPKPRANSAAPASRKPAPAPEGVVFNRARAPERKPRARYLTPTVAEKMRQKARLEPCHVREEAPSPTRAPHPRGGGPARKAPKASESGPKPPPALQYCLGKKLVDIRDQPSAAFISQTPRLMWGTKDVPAPGYTMKEARPTISRAFPDTKEVDDRSKGVTGFGSTAPRDLTFSLTNGSIRDHSPKKAKRTGPSSPRTSVGPAPQQTWETMKLYSSFTPTPFSAPERADRSSSWALSRVERDPYEIERVRKELKAREPRKPKGRVEKTTQKPQMTEKDWVGLARKMVARPPGRQETGKAAFGSSGPRQCLTFGKPSTAPAPGDYVIP